MNEGWNIAILVIGIVQPILFAVISWIVRRMGMNEAKIQANETKVAVIEQDRKRSDEVRVEMRAEVRQVSEDIHAIRGALSRLEAKQDQLEILIKALGKKAPSSG